MSIGLYVSVAGFMLCLAILVAITVIELLRPRDKDTDHADRTRT